MTTTNELHAHADLFLTPPQDISRRGFLQSSSGLIAGAAAAPILSRQGWAAAPSSSRDVFVYVFLRGGMDGLTTCVPHGDDDLYAARPTLAVPKPGQTNGALDLDGFFGLAPSAAPLLTPYNNGHLAIVHASGSTDPTRSHFDAYKFLEFGIPGQSLKVADDGWLARHLLTTAPVGAGDLRALAVHGIMPKTLMGAPATLMVGNMGGFAFPGDPGTAPQRSQAIDDLFAGAPEPLDPTAANTLGGISLLQQVDFLNYQPQNGAQYANDTLGQAFKQTAALIKADLGVEVIMIELDGWDHHHKQGPLDGDFAKLLGRFSDVMEAFYLDMLGELDRYTLVAMSEFGRRVAENSSNGTDHGHGNCMFAMGGHIAGGQVMGTWPGLDAGSLVDGDLAITTDYRDVCAEILALRMQNTDLGTVFPNHTPVFPGITV